MEALAQLVEEPVVLGQVALGQQGEPLDVFLLDGLDVSLGGDDLAAGADPVRLEVPGVDGEDEPPLLPALGPVTEGGAGEGAQLGGVTAPRAVAAQISLVSQPPRETDPALEEGSQILGDS